MPVVLVVDAAVEMAPPRCLAWNLGSDRLIAAFRQAIEVDRAGASTLGSHPAIQVISTAQIELDDWQDFHLASETVGSPLICPLTLHVPATLSFAGQAIYQQCREILDLRQWVQTRLGCAIGEGGYWLPIVQTAKGPLYAEVIGSDDAKAAQEKATTGSYLSYYQPLHLPDRWRQPLYQLGRSLLQWLAAPPAVYLLQFGFQQSEICFDRLWPFPAAPAIASLGVQTPDLFTCHWRCLTGQPIRDLRIPAIAKYQVFEGAI